MLPLGVTCSRVLVSDILHKAQLEAPLSLKVSGQGSKGVISSVQFSRSVMPDSLRPH